MEVSIMNALHFGLEQSYGSQDSHEPLSLEPGELQLRRTYFYATPPAATFREKNPATLFVRQGVIFADKTVIPVFVAHEVQDEQYH
jgi:hypothetical protein